MKRFLVIGLGVFGKNLAKKLMRGNAEVVAIDSRMEAVEEIQNDVTYSICLDSTDEKALVTLGLKDFDVAVVCIGENFEAMLLTSVLLKNNGVKKVITRASNPMHIKILQAVGIDEIITPEIEIAEKLASRLLFPKLTDIIFIDNKMALAKIKTPAEFVGKTLGELNLRAKYGITVLAIDHNPEDEEIDNFDNVLFSQKKSGQITNNPGANTVLNENDSLIIIGLVNDIGTFANSKK